MQQEELQQIQKWCQQSEDAILFYAPDGTLLWQNDAAAVRQKPQNSSLPRYHKSGAPEDGMFLLRQGGSLYCVRQEPRQYGEKPAILVQIHSQPAEDLRHFQRRQRTVSDAGGKRRPDPPHGAGRTNGTAEHHPGQLLPADASFCALAGTAEICAKKRAFGRSSFSGPRIVEFCRIVSYGTGKSTKNDSRCRKTTLHFRQSAAVTDLSALHGAVSAGSLSGDLPPDVADGTAGRSGGAAVHGSF